MVKFYLIFYHAYMLFILYIIVDVSDFCIHFAGQNSDISLGLYFSIFPLTTQSLFIAWKFLVLSSKWYSLLHNLGFANWLGSMAEEEPNLNVDSAVYIIESIIKLIGLLAKNKIKLNDSLLSVLFADLVILLIA